MKKIMLFALLLLPGTFAFAQQGELYVGEHYLFEGKDTARSFVILGADKDKFISGATAIMGEPAENRTGIMVWRNIKVENFGQVPLLQVADGIMTHDKKNKSACFVPFANAEDKQKKLANLQDNQERNMRVEFCDKNGKCIIYSRDKEKASKKFLTDAISKG